MNKDGKIFGKINIIDLLLILLLVVLALGIFVRVSGTRAKQIKNAGSFEYVIKIDDIRDCTLKALEKKGGVYNEKDNVQIGEITNVTSEPCKKEGVKSNGTRVFAERPDRFTAYVTIKAIGKCVDGTYYDAAENEIGAGRGHRVATKYAATSGEIISVKQ